MIRRGTVTAYGNESIKTIARHQNEPTCTIFCRESSRDCPHCMVKYSTSKIDRRLYHVYLKLKVDIVVLICDFNHLKVIAEKKGLASREEIDPKLMKFVVSDSNHRSHFGLE